MKKSIARVMTKLLTFLASFAFLVNMEHAQVMSVEDVQTFLVKIKSSLGIATTTNNARHLEDNQDCFALETQLYTNTTIAAADFLVFAFHKQWQNPNFDLEAFFDGMKFSSECERMGGEVIEVEFTLDNESVSVIIENYKLCKPAVCDTYEYLLTKRITYGYFAPYLKRDIGLDSEFIPSKQCLDDMIKTYNSTSLSHYSPEAFLSEGGAIYVEVSRDRF